MNPNEIPPPSFKPPRYIPEERIRLTAHDAWIPVIFVLCFGGLLTGIFLLFSYKEANEDARCYKDGVDLGVIVTTTGGCNVRLNDGRTIYMSLYKEIARQGGTLDVMRRPAP